MPLDQTELITEGIPDGNDATVGAKADAAATDTASSWSAIALLKGVFGKFGGKTTVGGKDSLNTYIANTAPIATGEAVIPYTNKGVGSAVQVYNGARRMKRIIGRNGTNAQIYLHVFDRSTTDPALQTGDATALFTIAVGIGIATSRTPEGRDAGRDWWQFTKGIYVAWSSTEATYTPLTPASQSIEVDHAA